MSNPTSPPNDRTTWFRLLVVVETLLGVIWLAFKLWTDLVAPLP